VLRPLNGEIRDGAEEESATDKGTRRGMERKRNTSLCKASFIVQRKIIAGLPVVWIYAS
jgi:hypothetical protein